MSERKRFLLRIDPKLYQALEKWAADELRSVNAQVEYLLTEAARRSGRLGAREDAGGGGADVNEEEPDTRVGREPQE